MSKLTKVLFAVLGLSMIASSYAEPVNINTATADEIAASIKGVGAKQAAAIVEYRDANGLFQSLAELENVKGVGAKTIAKNQDHILLQGEASLIGVNSRANSGAKSEIKPAVASTLSTAAPDLVNINSADAQELVILKGIGPAKAQAIIAYREAHGTFQAIDDLIKVKGIGEKTLAKNRDRIVIQ